MPLPLSPCYLFAEALAEEEARFAIFFRVKADPVAAHLLNLHALAPRTRANGPGVRFGVWFQGCSLGCPGCFNPTARPFVPRLLIAAEDLARRIAADPGIEGLSLSGGEPLDQSEGLLALLAAVRERRDLSVLLFSGYTLGEIRDKPLGPRILDHVDVLIDGRYDATRRLAHGLRGSVNQTVHLLTPRHTPEEIANVPVAEIIITPQGTQTLSGVAPPNEALSQRPLDPPPGIRQDLGI